MPQVTIVNLAPGSLSTPVGLIPQRGSTTQEVTLDQLQLMEQELISIDAQGKGRYAVIPNVVLDSGPRILNGLQISQSTSQSTLTNYWVNVDVGAILLSSNVYAFGGTQFDYLNGTGSKPLSTPSTGCYIVIAAKSANGVLGLTGVQGVISPLGAEELPSTSTILNALSASQILILGSVLVQLQSDGVSLIETISNAQRAT
jgi:hypothetical protein